MIPPQGCRCIAPIEAEDVWIIEIVSSKIAGNKNFILYSERVVGFRVNVIEVQARAVDRGIA